MSPYQFSWNNPILYNDPNGECPDCWEFFKGVGRGIGSGAVGTWNFATSDAWKADTWKSTGNLLLGAAAMGTTGNSGNLYAVDAALGTNTVDAVGGVSAAIDNVVGKVASGDPGAIGEVVGGAAWAGVEVAVGSKGASALTRAKTAANVVSTVDEVAAVGKGAANPKVAAAINRGKQAHADFSQKAAAKGWDVTPRLTDPKTGKTVIPDAITPGGHPIELKPNTPSGRAQGARQLPKYERATGSNGRVIYYDPKK